MSCGSSNYTMQEAIWGGLYTGLEINIWSCEVILYVMFCRRLPFENDNIQTLVMRISHMSAFFLLALYLGAHFFHA